MTASYHMRMSRKNRIVLLRAELTRERKKTTTANARLLKLADAIHNVRNLLKFTGDGHYNTYFQLGEIEKQLRSSKVAGRG